MSDVPAACRRITRRINVFDSPCARARAHRPEAPGSRSRRATASVSRHAVRRFAGAPQARKVQPSAAVPGEQLHGASTIMDMDVPGLGPSIRRTRRPSRRRRVSHPRTPHLPHPYEDLIRVMQCRCVPRTLPVRLRRPAAAPSPMSRDRRQAAAYRHSAQQLRPNQRGQAEHRLR